MASNKDLIGQAEALAAELGETIETEGLNNKALLELVKNLKSRSEDESTEDESTEDESTEDESTEDELEPSYYVVKGKAITSKRGIRIEGQIVEAKYFPGGEDTLKDLLRRGLVEYR